MRSVRMCIYGGTDLEGMPTTFVAALAEKILGSMPAVIVTGGFRQYADRPAAISTDTAALMGARRYVNESKRNLKECYEAWVPDPILDGRSDVVAIRMTEADGITVRVLTGRTALGRRLAMSLASTCL